MTADQPTQYHHTSAHNSLTIPAFVLLCIALRAARCCLVAPFPANPLRRSRVAVDLSSIHSFSLQHVVPCPSVADDSWSDRVHCGRARQTGRTSVTTAANSPTGPTCRLDTAALVPIISLYCVLRWLLCLLSPGHTSAPFIKEFAACLQHLRTIHRSTSGQPFILSGSGTLGWDLIAANLCESGHKALVVNTGYFSDSFADCLQTYGVEVAQVKCSEVGRSVDERQLRAALTSHPGLQLVVLTQVDTSTAVLNDIKGMAAVIRASQPAALIAVDGVCSFGGEEFLFDEWGVDAAMSCSQKALGAPPGLSTLLLSPRALQFVQSGRHTPIPSFFGSLLRWLPIMRAYEAEQPSYFATPNTSLIRALEVSLRSIVEYGLEKRWADHVAHSNAFKAAMSAIGLTQLAEPHRRANTLSAVYYPNDIDTSKFLSSVLSSGVICAGGLHKDVKAKYFRSVAALNRTPQWNTTHTAEHNGPLTYSLTHSLPHSMDPLPPCVACPAAQCGSHGSVCQLGARRPAPNCGRHRDSTRSERLQVRAGQGSRRLRARAGQGKEGEQCSQWRHESDEWPRQAVSRQPTLVRMRDRHSSTGCDKLRILYLLPSRYTCTHSAVISRFNRVPSLPSCNVHRLPCMRSGCTRRRMEEKVRRLVRVKELTKTTDEDPVAKLVETRWRCMPTMHVKAQQRCMQ